MDIEKMKEELIRDEGIVLHAYDDSLGYTTIGVGRMIDHRLGGGITTDEAMYLLENDIGRVVIDLRKALPKYETLSENRQRALVNMAFNLGIGRLMGFKKLIDAINIGNWERAYIEALDSKWAAQVGNRAVRIAGMLRKG